MRRIAESHLHYTEETFIKMKVLMDHIKKHPEFEQLQESHGEYLKYLFEVSASVGFIVKNRSKILELTGSNPDMEDPQLQSDVDRIKKTLESYYVEKDIRAVARSLKDDMPLFASRAESRASRP